MLDLFCLISHQIWQWLLSQQYESDRVMIDPSIEFYVAQVFQATMVFNMAQLFEATI